MTYLILNALKYFVVIKCKKLYSYFPLLFVKNIRVIRV